MRRGGGFPQPPHPPYKSHTHKNKWRCFGCSGRVTGRAGGTSEAGGPGGEGSASEVCGAAHRPLLRQRSLLRAGGGHQGQCVARASSARVWAGRAASGRLQVASGTTLLGSVRHSDWTLRLQT